MSAQPEMIPIVIDDSVNETALLARNLWKVLPLPELQKLDQKMCSKTKVSKNLKSFEGLLLLIGFCYVAGLDKAIEQRDAAMKKAAKNAVAERN